MRIRTKFAALASITALVLGVGLATATVVSAAPPNVTFSSTPGNSVGWNADHTALVFDMNNASAPKGRGGAGYAIANLQGTPSALPTAEPAFSGTGIAAGTPRMDIFLSDGSYFFVYNDGTWQYNPNGGGQSAANCYGGDCASSWATEANTLNGANLSVSQVYMVADASQSVPYEATVTSLTYAGTTYVP